MLSVSKPTLVQLKKQQWAKEREEMSHLYLPWGTSDRYSNGVRGQSRNQFASTLELHKQSSNEYQEPVQRQRSPSLPPIHHADQATTREDNRSRRSKDVLNRNISTAKRFAFYDEDGEGDTSGYGSETLNHRSLHELPHTHNPVLAWHQNDDNRNRPPSGSARSVEDLWSGRSPRLNTAEEGRPKWGDRGVATGRLWEPTAPNERLPQMPNAKKGTPSWVERGLNMIENTAEVLVIDQSSTNSGFDCDRSSCNGSDEGKTFLRGQNVPIEPEIKAQRETQRIKALELQSAILSQLEDREKRRQEERERKLKEEKLEEIRIQQQQEQDRQRLEQEKRKNQEKQLIEQRKLENLKKALEDAEKQARQEKEKRYSFLKQNMNINTSAEYHPIHIEPSDQVEDDAKVEGEINRSKEHNSPTKTHRTYDVHSAKSQNFRSKDFNSHQTTEFNSPRSLAQSANLNLLIQNVPPLTLTENQYSIVPIGLNGDMTNSQQNGIQLAVLVPQNLSNSLYSVSLNSLNNANDFSETNKILTPRKYRSARNKNVGTQTDLSLLKYPGFDKASETEDVERNIDKDYPNIDENAPQDTHTKKDRRFRSEERYKKDLENRPKWGVNRPAAQYKKQSEKDPFYSQKRKMRHKYRAQARQYLSQSSEDSRSPSPPLRSAELMSEPYEKPRHSLSQSYWKNKKSGQDLKPANTTNATDNASTATELSLTSIANDIISENKKSPINRKMSPSKRLTLSQKFMNDKYGNKKLWIEDDSKYSTFNVEDRKLLDQINSAKREFLDRNEDQEN